MLDVALNPGNLAKSKQLKLPHNDFKLLELLPCLLSHVALTLILSLGVPQNDFIDATHVGKLIHILYDAND